MSEFVPEQIPPVAALVTSQLQAPLAHVAVLSRNRNTPSMSLRGAIDLDVFTHLEGQLVKLSVTGQDYAVAPAALEEAQAAWATRRPAAAWRPVADGQVGGLFDMANLDTGSARFVGAKAAQMAQLSRVEGLITAGGFAIPFSAYLDHLRQAGLDAELSAMLDDPAFAREPRARSQRLANLRAAILDHPVQPELLAEVHRRLEAWAPQRRTLFRSSTNAEDLDGFNGAGLYTSLTARADDPDASVEAALQTVWASLWSDRAFDERESAHVDQRAVAIGVLVHGAFPAERANGVAISRNILEPLYRDAFINAQVGEASVTNPAQGVTTDQLVRHARARPAWTEYLARSSLAGGRDVLTEPELARLSCVLEGVHDHFKRVLDPTDSNRWFAVDVEFKLLGDERALLLKQARPYTFGRVEIPADCREF